MIPPGVEREWDENTPLVQSYILSYDQIRQIEEVELLTAMVPKL